MRDPKNISLSGPNPPAILHVEVDGGLINIRPHLRDEAGNPVISIEIRADGQDYGSPAWWIEGKPGERYLNVRIVSSKLTAKERKDTAMTEKRAKPQFSIPEIKEWRAKAHAEGRPDTFEAFFAAHNYCIACLGRGYHPASTYADNTEYTICSVCNGTGDYINPTPAPTAPTAKQTLLARVQAVSEDEAQATLERLDRKVIAKGYFPVLHLHRDDLIDRGYPKAADLDDSAMEKLADKIGDSLTENDYFWGAMEAIAEYDYNLLKTPPCSTCHGDGVVLCPTCDGHSPSWEDQCEQCNNEGEIDCPECKGTGFQPKNS